MESSIGLRKFVYRWLLHQHYKKRILMRYCPRWALERKFKKRLGYKLNLENPKTLNDKLQWFKWNVRDPRTTKCADKYAVREYVKKKIGEQYLVPLLGVYDSVEEIDISKLPKEFVFKPNHESGRVILCHDKDKINWRKKADVMENWLRENFYYETGEWQYKDIPPKIVCEKMLHGDVIDYKFFCFKGNPAFVHIIESKGTKHYDLGNYDLDFHFLKTRKDKKPSQNLKMPEHWNEMIRIARILAEEFPFVRVDLYDLEGKVYFGELTFTPGNGMSTHLSYEWDKKMGELYDIHAWPK